MPVAGRRRTLLGKAHAEYSMPLELPSCGTKRSLDENDSDSRDPGLNACDPRNPNQPPYTPQFVARYRTAQLSRKRRR
jgi:hypothetical protein